MRKITGIIFGISTSFMLIMLTVMIIRLSVGKEAYLPITNIFKFIETFEGYEILKNSIEEINVVIESSFGNWKEFSFASSNMQEFFENIGQFISNFTDSFTGVFELIIYGVKGIWDFVWYILKFVFDFMIFIVS